MNKVFGNTTPEDLHQWFGGLRRMVQSEFDRMYQQLPSGQIVQKGPKRIERVLRKLHVQLISSHPIQPSIKDGPGCRNGRANGSRKVKEPTPMGGRGDWTKAETKARWKRRNKK